ncbi:hypothetical protein GIB67_023531 [Kingdonia uniflora]|uniref:Cytochrome P450 n=1 Tax=Kingdonia uniflora TaxID=39325 RepID=A0A7J7PA77_9MAGN|nr:hypothetical protein GIB67_023531 [Kingdonia uniflora]
MIDDLLLFQRADPEQYSDNTINGLITVNITGHMTHDVLDDGMGVNNPEVLCKAHSEIERNIQQGILLDESNLPKLQYLNCIINETLRLYPVVLLLIPHFSSEECTVGGYNVPSGTMLITNAWAIHRDPKVWVEPGRFMPERFECGEGDKGDGYKFIPFGLGRRSCPSSGLAMRMMGLALGTLIQCFEWKRIGEEQVDMWEGSGITLPKTKPLVVMCEL